MNGVKDLYIPTFEDDYRENVQLQFNDDEKFLALLKGMCELGIEYQQTLKDLNKMFSLADSNNRFQEVTPQNTFILNSIGKLLNIPPIDFFQGYITDGTYTEYLLLLKGQIAKNAYDGSNDFFIPNPITKEESPLNQIFEGNFTFFLYDNGDMNITIYLLPTGTPITANVKYLFEHGYFTPKPAGVGVTYSVLDKISFVWDKEYKLDEQLPQGGWDLGTWN